MALGPLSSLSTVSAVTMSLPAKTAVGAGAALIAFALWSVISNADPVAVPNSPAEPLANDLQASVDGKSAKETAPDTKTVRSIIGEATTTTRFAVRGFVRQPNGTMMSGAALLARQYRGYDTRGEPEHEETLTTKPDGTFVLRLQPPDHTISLVFQSGDESSWHGYGRSVAIHGRPAPRDVAVQAFPMDVWIEGRVRDTNGKPLAEATVRNPFADREVSSAADGRFAIQSSSISSNAVLYCRRAGYAVAKAEIGTGSKSGRILHDFTLQPGLTIRGKIVDSTGSPIASAQINSSFWFGQLGSSASDGTFVLSSLDPTKEKQFFWFHHRTHLSKELTVQTADAKKDLVVTLLDGVRVEGQVFGPDGKPVPGARLRISLPQTNGDQATSQDDGSFEFLRAPRGKLELVAECSGMAKATMSVDVPDSAPEIRDVVVQMDRERFLGGRIVDAAGQPIGIECGVAAFQGSQHYGDGGRCNAEGQFRLSGLPAGTVRLEVYGSGYLRRDIASVRVGREDMEIVLQRGAGFAGTVLDATSGKPIQKSEFAS